MPALYSLKIKGHHIILLSSLRDLKDLIYPQNNILEDKMLHAMQKYWICLAKFCNFISIFSHEIHF